LDLGNWPYQLRGE